MGDCAGDSAGVGKDKCTGDCIFIGDCNSERTSTGDLITDRSIS